MKTVDLEVWTDGRWWRLEIFKIL